MVETEPGRLQQRRQIPHHLFGFRGNAPGDEFAGGRVDWNLP